MHMALVLFPCPVLLLSTLQVVMFVVLVFDSFAASIDVHKLSYERTKFNANMIVRLMIEHHRNSARVCNS